jgi:hypothetical protein
VTKQQAAPKKAPAANVARGKKWSVNANIVRSWICKGSSDAAATRWTPANVRGLQWATRLQLLILEFAKPHR